MSDHRKYLARHLRSLSLQMMETSLQTCRSLDPDLEPTWGSILEHLAVDGRLTVMEASKRMRVSHVHAQKQLKAMKKAFVVQDSPDPNDGRRTYYALTERGQSLLPLVRQISSSVDQVIEDIERETGDSLFAALSSFQKALGKKSWRDRVSEKLKQNEDR